MNKQIELVEKWLADKNSVSQLELKVNADAAYVAANAADVAANAADVAAYAAAAYDADDAAYFDAYRAVYCNTRRLVAKYHALVKENNNAT
jgi:hypothetical protein